MLKCFSSFQPDTKGMFERGSYLYFETSLIQILSVVDCFIIKTSRSKRVCSHCLPYVVVVVVAVDSRR